MTCIQTNLKLLLLLVFSLISIGLNAQERKVSYDIEFNLTKSTNNNAPFYSLKQNNIGVSAWFNFRKKQNIGIRTSLNTKFLSTILKEEQKFFKENFYFLEITPQYSYTLFGLEEHVISHGLGFVIGLNQPNYSVDATEDTKFFQSIIYMFGRNSTKLPTYSNIYGFFETGYDFYMYRGLHFSLTGRVTLLSYRLNVDSEYKPLNPNPKKLGLNYMLFYGLGYTFGKK